ncbi:hypothetical protein KZO61_13690, partial [Prevotella nigrescens]|uniref:hypothetical protein n=1 Tax=Prevotella nigrescens TaxID=28133 RepID=UPI001C5D8951
RNKVAVPEGAAGTPPFWMGLLQAGIFCMVRCACSMDRQEVSLLVLSSLFCNIKINKEDKVGGLRLWFKSIVFTHHVAPFTTLHLWYRSLTC